MGKYRCSMDEKVGDRKITRSCESYSCVWAFRVGVICFGHEFREMGLAVPNCHQQQYIYTLCLDLV